MSSNTMEQPVTLAKGDEQMPHPVCLQPTCDVVWCRTVKALSDACRERWAQVRM